MRSISKLLTLLSLALVFTTLNANIDRIAGTYSCFQQPDAAELFSPIHGAIAWETGTIRRIYDFGHRFDVEAAKAKFLDLQKPPEAAEEQKGPEEHKQPEAHQPQDLQKFLRQTLKAHLEDTPAVVQLVHLIFHRQALDSVNPADFVVTNGLRELDPRIVALLVGHILVNLEALELAQKPLSEGKDIHTPLDTLTQFMQEITSQSQAKEHKQKDGNPTDDSMLSKKFLKKISDTLVTNFKSDAIKILSANKAQLDKRSQLFKEIAGMSFQAFLFSGPFPPETVRLVLLALLYQTSHLEPKILATYYNTLLRLDGVQIKKQEASEKKEPIAQPFTAQNLNAFTQLIRAINTPEAFRQRYEQLTYVFLYPHFQVAPYATASLLKQDGSPTLLTFTDCMDNTFRNLFNLLAFDGNSLTLAKLNTISPDLYHRLDAFYAQPIPLTAVTQPEQHNQWTRVISNLPYVAYVHKNDTPLVPKDWPGYIKIPAADFAGPNNPLQTFLTQHDYTVLPFEQGKEEEVITYEIQPSLRNFIIVLNTLLNLKIFKEPLSAEFIKPDFVSTHLPQILQKIQALNVKYKDEKHQIIDLQKIDALDVAGRQLIIVTDNFNISVNSGHGEFDVPYHAQEKTFPNIDINSPILPYSSILLPGEANVIAMLQDQQKRYLSLFSLPLENPDRIVDFSDRIPPTSQLFDLFIYLIKRHPDVLQQLHAQFNLYIHYIKNTDRNNIPAMIVKNAINKISKLLKQTALNTDLGIELFKELIAKGLAVEEFINMAGQLLTGNSLALHANGLTLYKELIAKGHGVEEFINMAHSRVKSDDAYTQHLGLELFKNLVKKSQGLQQAIDAAALRIVSYNSAIHDDSMELFTELIKNETSRRATESKIRELIAAAPTLKTSLTPLLGQEKDPANPLAQ